MRSNILATIVALLRSVPGSYPARFCRQAQSRMYQLGGRGGVMRESTKHKVEERESERARESERERERE